MTSSTVHGTTQNGWPFPPFTRTYVVPGTDVSLVLTADQNAAYCLVWCVQQWNQTIEAVKPDQTGGYDSNRPIGGLAYGSTSNHMSGTAVDVNYTDHPQYGHTFSDAMTAKIHGIIAETEGVVRWGGDWSASSLDQQHIEICTLNGDLIKTVADKLHGLAGTPTTPIYGPPVVAGSATTDPTTVTLVKLPAVPLTPISGKSPANALGQLGQVRLGGASFVTDIEAAVTSATMSYSSTEVGALSLTVQDDRRGALLRSGYVALGVPVTFGDQRMDIRTIETGDGQGGPQFRIEARSRTIYRLRSGPQAGEGSWGVVDTSQWVVDRAAEVGARAVVQPGLYKLVITRLATETTWDVLQKLAGLHQAWCFECEQTIWFGQPTWFASRKQVRGWQLHWASLDDYTPGLAAFPDYRSTTDASSPDQVESLTLTLNSADAYQFRPADLVNLTGAVGEAVGWWIATDVSLDLGGTARVAASVICQRVVDPAPTGVVDQAGTGDPNNQAPVVPGAGQP